MRLDAALASVGGVAPTHVLLDRGVGRWELSKGVDDGRAMRIRPGVLALPGADTAFVTAVVECSRVTCVSAATYYDLWRVRDSAALHLSRPDAVRSDCVNHRTRSAPVHARLPLVGLVDVLVHVLQCRPPEESVPMVESSLRRGDTVHSLLEARLRGRRNAPGRAALAQVEYTADSAIEVVTRLLLRGAGLDVRPQAMATGVGRVDFLVEGFLIVEIDGAAFHSSRQALRRDRLRNNMSVIEGYSVLRFCYEDVMYRQDELLAQVLSVLGRRPIRCAAACRISRHPRSTQPRSGVSEADTPPDGQNPGELAGARAACATALERPGASSHETCGGPCPARSQRTGQGSDLNPVNLCDPSQ